MKPTPFAKDNLFFLHKYHTDAARILLNSLQTQREQNIPPIYRIIKTSEEQSSLLQTYPNNVTEPSFYRESLHTIQHLNPKNTKTIILWSCGLGIQIQAITPLLEHLKLLVVEPDPELFFLLLQYQDCRALLQSPNLLLFLGEHAQSQSEKLIKRYRSVFQPGTPIFAGRRLSTAENADFIALKKALSTPTRSPNSTYDPQPSHIAFTSTDAHSALLPVLVNEAHEIHWTAQEVTRSSTISRFIQNPEMLRETLGEPTPSTVLTFSHQVFYPDEWQRMKEKGIQCCFWCYDDPHRNDRHSVPLELYDRIYCFDPIHTQNLQKTTAIPIEYLPAATSFPDGIIGSPPAKIPESLPISFVGSTGLQRMDDAIRQAITQPAPFFKTIQQFVEAAITKGQPIDINGLWQLQTMVPIKNESGRMALLEDLATYILRVKFLNALHGSSLTIYGDPGWKQQAFAGSLCQHYAGSPLDFLRETPWIYHRSQININLFNVQCLNSPTIRLFDVMACGGFLLTEYRPFLDTMFECGKELETFRNPTEFREKVEFYLAHPQLCQEIAQRGKEKIFKNHRYRHRLPKILANQNP